MQSCMREQCSSDAGKWQLCQPKKSQSAAVVRVSRTPPPRKCRTQRLVAARTSAPCANIMRVGVCLWVYACVLRVSTGLFVAHAPPLDAEPYRARFRSTAVKCGISGHARERSRPRRAQHQVDGGRYRGDGDGTSAAASSTLLRAQLDAGVSLNFLATQSGCAHAAAAPLRAAKKTPFILVWLAGPCLELPKDILPMRLVTHKDTRSARTTATH